VAHNSTILCPRKARKAQKFYRVAALTDGRAREFVI